MRPIADRADGTAGPTSDDPGIATISEAEHDRRIARELWRAAWRMHGRDVLAMGAVVVGLRIVVTVLMVSPLEGSRLLEYLRVLEWMGSLDFLPSLFGIYFGAYCGSRLGGGETAAGVEPFAFALPPRRATRFRVRFAFGLAASVIVATAVAAAWVAELFLIGRRDWPTGQVALGTGYAFAITTTWALLEIAPVLAYVLAFAWASNAHSRRQVGSAGPASVAVVGVLLLTTGYIAQLMAVSGHDFTTSRWFVVSFWLPFVLLGTAAAWRTYTGYRRYVDKEAVDRPSVGDVAPLAASRRLPATASPAASPARTRWRAVAVAGGLLGAVVAMASWARPYRLAVVDHFGGALVGPMVVTRNGVDAVVEIGGAMAMLDVSEPSSIGLESRGSTLTSPGEVVRSLLDMDIDSDAGLVYVLRPGPYTWNGEALALVDVTAPDRRPRRASAGNDMGGGIVADIDRDIDIPNARRLAVLNGVAYVMVDGLAGQAGLHVVDATDPLSPTVRGVVPIDGWPTDVAVTSAITGEGHVFVTVARDGRFKFNSYTIEPGVPAPVGSLVLPESISYSDNPVVRIVVARPYLYAYLVTSRGHVLTVDIGDPTRPRLVATSMPSDDASQSGRAAGRVWHGMRAWWSADAVFAANRLYVVHHPPGRLLTFDVDDLAAPRLVHTRMVGPTVRHLAFANGTLFATDACFDGGTPCNETKAHRMTAFAVDDGGVPRPDGRYDSFLPQDVAIVNPVRGVGARALVAAGDRRTLVFDLTDPAHPKPAGAIGPAGAVRVEAVGVSMAASATAYVGTDVDGADGSIWRVDLSRRDDAGISVVGGAGREVALVAASRDFLLFRPEVPLLPKVGFPARNRDDDGIHAVDVRDPSEPVGVGELQRVNNARAAAIYKGYAYVFSDSLLAFDLLGESPLDPVFARDVDFGNRQARVDADRSELVVAAEMSGLERYDLSRPEAPDRVPEPREPYVDGRWLGSVRDADARGGFAFVAAGNERVGLLDVSNPRLTRALAMIEPVRATGIRAVSGKHAIAFSAYHGLRVVEVKRGWWWEGE